MKVVQEDWLRSAQPKLSAKVLLLLPLPGDEVLPLHGGGGQAGGLAALVLRLLRQLGEVLPLSLRPLLVRLGGENISIF